MAFCSACGNSLPEGAQACPKCGAGVSPAFTAQPGYQTVGQSGGQPFAQTTSPPPIGTAPVASGLTDNIAGALAYVTIIPAIVFLVVAPYNKNRFIRFHSFQSIFFSVAWVVLWKVLGIVVHIPLLGWATILLWPVISLGGFIIWLILVAKAYSGQMFKLPGIGDFAEKQANAA